MSSPQPQNFEYNAKAMRLVIQRLLAIHEDFTRVHSHWRESVLSSRSFRSSLAPHDVQVLDKYESDALEFSWHLQTHDKKFKKGLRDPIMSDLAVLGQYVMEEMRKYKNAFNVFKIRFDKHTIALDALFGSLDPGHDTAAR